MLNIVLTARVTGLVQHLVTKRLSYSTLSGIVSWPRAATARLDLTAARTAPGNSSEAAPRADHQASTGVEQREAVRHGGWRRQRRHYCGETPS